MPSPTGRILRDRWYGPLLLTAALLAALILLLVLLDRHDRRQRQEQLQQHARFAQHSLNLKFVSDRDLLAQYADGVARGMLTVEQFQRDVEEFVQASPELENLVWLDAEGQSHWYTPEATAADALRWLPQIQEAVEAIDQVRRDGPARYSRPFLGLHHEPLVLLLVPLRVEGRFLGLLVASYNLSTVLGNTFPTVQQQTASLCLFDKERELLFACDATDPHLAGAPLTLALPALGDALQLQVGERGGDGLRTVQLLALVAVALALGLGWGMWALQRDIALRQQAERDLQSHLTLLQTILTSTPDAIYLKDGEGRYRMINQAGARLLGYAPEEVVGKTDRELIRPALAEVVERDDEGVTRTGRPQTREEQFEREGALQFLLTTKAPFYDEDGAISGIVGVRRDITDRKAAELELQQSEQRFRTMFEAAVLGVATLAPDRTLLQANPSLRRFLEDDQREIEGALLDMFIADEDRKRVRQGFQAALGEPDATVSLAVRFLTLQQRSVWGHLVASLVRSATQEPEYWVVMVQDVDARKRAEEALRLSEERYRMLFAAGSDALLVYDLGSGRVLDANPAAIALFGHPLEALQQTKITDLFAPQQPVGCDKVEPLSANVRRIPLAYMLRADGSSFPADIASGSFRWQNQPLVVAMIRDITERRKLEEMKDDMLSSVSHEMRTPLTAMLGFAEFLLNNEASAEQQREFLEIIHQESLRLKELIDNLLNLQRLRAGFGLARVGPVSVPALLYDVVALFAPKHRQHRFEVACADDLPVLQADESQLFQALRNLVSNAVKYSPEGGLVRLAAVATDDGVRLEVRDEGLGVPPTALERIFERFYRVTTNGHQRIGGTGLGLPLVREIARRHGGQAWAESVYGQGSTFFLKLPLVPPQVTAPEGSGVPTESQSRTLMH